MDFRVFGTKWGVGPKWAPQGPPVRGGTPPTPPQCQTPWLSPAGSRPKWKRDAPTVAFLASLSASSGHSTAQMVAQRHKRQRHGGIWEPAEGRVLPVPCRRASRVSQPRIDMGDPMARREGCPECQGGGRRSRTPLRRRSPRPETMVHLGRNEGWSEGRSVRRRRSQSLGHHDGHHDGQPRGQLDRLTGRTAR